MVMEGMEESYPDVDMDLEEYSSINQYANNNSDQLSNRSQSMYNNMFGKSSEDTDTLSRLSGSSFSVMQLMFNIPSLIYTTLNSLAMKLSIPTVFIGIVFSILTIMFIFSVIYILFGVSK